MCVCSTNLGFSMIPGTYVYQVRIMYQIRVYLVSAGRNLYVRTLCSARGRTSDDSYIYQLSLVVATATMYLCPEVLPLQRYWSLCYDCELDFGRWVNVRNQQQHQQSP